MSVINQMLKDLEARRSVSVHGRYISPARKGEVSWLLWLPVSLLLGIGVGLLFWHQFREAAPVSSSTPVVIAPVKGSGGMGGTPATTVATPGIQDKSAAQGSPAASIDTPVSASQSAQKLSVATSGASALSSAVAVPEEETEANEPPVTQGADLAEVAGGQNEKETTDDPLTLDSGGEAFSTLEASSPFSAAPPQDQLQIDEVTLSPDEEAALQRKQAEQAMDRGELTKAKEALYALLQAKPSDTQAREKLAALLFGAGDEARARRVLEQGMALAPNYANFRLLSARIDMSNGQKSRALAALRGSEPDVGSNMDFYATRAALV